MARDTEYILELLVEYGMVTREQVARAREEAEASGGTLDPVECLKKDGSVRVISLKLSLKNTHI